MADTTTPLSTKDVEQAITIKMSATRSPYARLSTWSERLTVAEATARAATIIGHMDDVSPNQHRANLVPSTQLVAAGGLT
jgi:hypothetical protein